MIVFHAGLPRSGTVLVGAILRQLLAAEGVGVVQHNPHGPELIAVMDRLDGDGLGPRAAHLIHTHSWDAGMASRLRRSTGAQVFGFLCERDPRDVCVSLMRLHDLPFEDAADLTLAHLSHFDWAKAETGWPVLRYADLVQDKRAQIRAIATHLGRAPSDQQLERIDAATSVARHRAIMERVREGAVAQVVERRNRYRTLREDAETRINDRHIQSGKIGRWKDELSQPQKARLANLFAGYAARLDP